MTSELRRFVQDRADDRCEYCHIRQKDDPFYTFHVEHIVARQHGGDTVPENLCLSCNHCNYHKGSNLTGIDPVSGEVVRLFDPRYDDWDEHFQRNGSAIVGRTPSGRATVRLLMMNLSERLQLRG